MVLSPTSVAFQDTTGNSTTKAQSVSITSLGAGTTTVTGLTLGTVTYTGGATGWLTATLSGADAPATLSIAAKKNALQPGNYTATVPVTSSMAANSPQTVTVTLHLDLPPPPAPPPGPTITVIAVGNLGSCGGDLGQQSAKLIAAAHPDYVFMLGGSIPGPSAGKLTTLQDYMSCYDPTWGQFRSITYASLGAKEVDIDTVPPDYGSGKAPGADAYFGQARIGPPGQNWYSFDLNSWHIISLNVESPGGYKRPLAIQYHAGSDQLNWLYNDLQSHSNKCTLAFFYQAMWISSTTIDPNTPDRYPNHGYRIQDIRGIWTALYDNNADLVINGNPHIYERFAPMFYANGYQHPTESEYAPDSVRGIRQITSGLGGDGPIVADSAVIKHPLSEYRSGGNGVLKLVLGDGAYTWEFLNTKYSHIQDHGAGKCH